MIALEVDGAERTRRFSVICAITGAGIAVGCGGKVGGIACATGGARVGTAVFGGLVGTGVAVGVSAGRRLLN